jgi:hypothetical protein
MQMPRLRAAWALAVVACAAIALVSGTVFVIAAVIGSGSDASAGGTDGHWQRSIAWPVSVRRTADPRTAVVVYDVPAGQPDCFRKPVVKVDRDTTEAVHVTLTYEVGRMDCTLTSHDEISVTSRTPLRDRDIVVNGESWTPAKPGYRRCGSDGCSPPPPAQCSTDRVDGAMEAVDADGDRTVRSCTSRWLIVDVGTDTRRRWFFEYRDKAWRPLLGTRNPGCASILTIASEFPRDLCADLPLPR